ncbi:MAG: hypothetical protein CVU56_29655, partial [Deltaproteobacteria bacterium HGW-Deltaproteobacteria-14]
MIEALRSERTRGPAERAQDSAHEDRRARARTAVQRRTAIDDYSVAVGAPPLQLRRFDTVLSQAHDGIALNNHELYGDPLPQHLAVQQRSRPGVVQRSAPGAVKGKQGEKGKKKVGAVAQKHAGHIQSQVDAKLKQAIEGIAAAGSEMAEQVGAALDVHTAQAYVAWVAKNTKDPKLAAAAAQILNAARAAQAGGAGGAEAGSAGGGEAGVQKRAAGGERAVDVHAAA